MCKKFFLISIFILGVSPIIYARYRTTMYRNINYFSISGGIGYSSLIENIPELNTRGSLGSSLLLGYELRISHFWLNTGFETQYLRATSTFNISGFDRMAYDTQGKEVLYHYNFDESADNQQFIFANIPLLLGWHYIGFYLGAGAKVGCCLTATEDTKLRYSTTGSYLQYVEDFEKMEDHFYSTYSTTNKEQLDSRWKISLIGEIGYDVLAWARQANHTKHYGLKIDAYVEYGLNNIIHSSSQRPLYIINEDNISSVSATPFYNAHSSNAYRVIPLYAGVRISWIFCIKTKHCDCNIWDNHKAFYKRYNNILH